MKLTAHLLLPVFLVATANAAEVGLRIRLGLTDKSPTKWDGSIRVEPGRVAQITGWRFGAADEVRDAKSWTCSTRHQPPVGARKAGKRAGKAADAALGPMLENGVVVTLADVSENSRVEVKTAHGDFSFSIADVAFGAALPQLNGAASVDRVASGVQLTKDRADDDFPAAAVANDGTIYLAYISFTPGLDRDKRARALDAEIKDFSELAKPAGGDQLWLRTMKNGRWTEPVAVTAGKGDLFKCAVAVDGGGCAWVFWSENKDGNFDLWARPFKAGQPGEGVRLTTDAGPDLAPVAATDAQGRVWVAWQGARQNVFRILSRHQKVAASLRDASASSAKQGAGASRSDATTSRGWSDETVVSSQARNCWDPAIAASAGVEGKTPGRVAIAWDTYEKGDYDVWLSEFDSSAKAAEPRPVAATLKFEARPSLAYDKAARLWLAWEEAAEMWAKDYGALDKQAVPIYQSGRSINLRVLQDGQWNDTLAPVGDALSGAQRPRAGKKAKAAPQADEPTTFNNFARLATDRDGRVWLLCRSRQLQRSNLGTVWISNAAFYDGGKWTGPILVTNSDNQGDNRPALLAAPDDGLLIAYSSDHRQRRGPGQRRKLASAQEDGDPFENDIMIARLAIATPPAAAGLKPASAPVVAKQAGYETKECEDVARIRGYRTNVGGAALRILRGEFHRHTEISGDGANDGPLMDMWRYALDAASMDWIGNGDHDNGGGREYPWWITQKSTDAYRLAGVFEPMFTYERSVRYPEGHRNVVFAKRGIRTLPRLPKQNENDAPPAPDTQMLYRYLRFFDGVCAVHTSATDMGTDWRDNDPKVEPIVEIYQGDRQNYEMPGAPRSNKEGDSLGGFQAKGFVSLALQKGYRLGFQASSDHISTHISYCCVYVGAVSRDAILAGMKARHIYGATDNIIADVRCKAGEKEYFMGDQFATRMAPTLHVKLIGTAPFAKVTIVKDNEYVHTAMPKSDKVDFNWTDMQPTVGKTSYYYVRGEQADGELVWVSPMWIRFEKR